MSTKQIIDRLIQLSIQIQESTCLTNGELLKEYFDLKKKLSSRFIDL